MSQYKPPELAAWIDKTVFDLVAAEGDKLPPGELEKILYGDPDSPPPGAVFHADAVTIEVHRRPPAEG